MDCNNVVERAAGLIAELDNLETVRGAERTKLRIENIVRSF